MTGPVRAGDRWTCDTCGEEFLFYSNASQCCPVSQPVQQDVPQSVRHAIPDRYQVTRNGAADPEASRYVVLDVVHDWTARVALQRLIASYRASGATTHAQELEDFLGDTQPAARAALNARSNRWQATATRKGKR